MVVVVFGIQVLQLLLQTMDEPAPTSTPPSSAMPSGATNIRTHKVSNGQGAKGVVGLVCQTEAVGTGGGRGWTRWHEAGDFVAGWEIKPYPSQGVFLPRLYRGGA